MRHTGPSGRPSHLVDMTAMAFALLVCAGLWMAGCGEDEEPDKNNNQTGCATNEDCLGSSVCVVGSCRDCSQDSDCEAGQVCIELECVADDENNDLPDADTGVEDVDVMMDADVAMDTDAQSDADVALDVPDEEDVFVSSCAEGCPGLQQCDEESESCIEPSICLGDADCYGGRLCFNGSCTRVDDLQSAGGCSGDSQCQVEGADFFCNVLSHTCQPSGPCTADAQCAGDLVCDGAGTCVPCTSDANCEGGLVCDTESQSTTRYICVEPASCGSEDDCHGDRVCMGGSCAEPACEGDMFDSGSGNKSCSDAAQVDSGTTYALEVCGAECDWFEVELAQGDGLVARALHAPIDGDLDLVLRAGPCMGASAGEVVSRAATLDAAEIVSLPRARQSGTYFLSVCPFLESFDEGTNAYVLDVEVIEGGFCIEDVFDTTSPNDVANDALVINTSALPARFAATNLQVCPGAPDWFVVDLDEGDFVVAKVDYVDVNGNIDLAVYEGLPPSADTPARYLSSGRVNTETVAFTARETGEYYIKVFSPTSQGQNRYDLSVDVVSDPCADRFELTPGANNSLTLATTLAGPGPTTYGGLRLCDGDSDWYVTRLAAGDATTLRVTWDSNSGTDLIATVHGSSTDAEPMVIQGRRGVLDVVGLVEMGDRVYVEITQSGAETVAYQMVHQVVPEDEACLDDGRNNNTFASAFEAPLGVQEYPGQICAGDQAQSDYFAIEITQTSDFFADVFFDSAAGGLDLRLLASDMSELGAGVTDADGLHLDAELAPGSYVIAVDGLDAQTQLSYLAQFYANPSIDADTCGEDALERGTASPSQPNDAWDNGTEISDGAWFTNLVACPGNSDWYLFFSPAGTDIRVTIETNVFDDGVLSARAWGVGGPPSSPLTGAQTSMGGVLVLDIPWFNIFDGGMQAVEISGVGAEAIFYDLRLDILQ